MFSKITGKITGKALKDNSGGKKERTTQKVGVETRCNARQGIGIGIVGAGWAR